MDLVLVHYLVQNLLFIHIQAFNSSNENVPDMVRHRLLYSSSCLSWSLDILPIRLWYYANEVLIVCKCLSPLPHKSFATLLWTHRCHTAWYIFHFSVTYTCILLSPKHDGTQELILNSMPLDKANRMTCRKTIASGLVIVSRGV